MPRPGPRRKAVAIKLDDETIAAADRRALDEDLTIRGGEPNRSELLRLAITYGMANMPAGWRPGDHEAQQEALRATESASAHGESGI